MEKNILIKSKNVSNLKVANGILAKFLISERLVLPSDILIESTRDIASSILINEEFHKNRKSIILSEIDPTKIFFSELMELEDGHDEINFLSNGTFPNSKNFIAQVLNNGAFNVGVCTSDNHEYARNNRFLQRFKGNLLAIGIPVTEHQETLSNYQLYLLSYRYKNGRK